MEVESAVYDALLAEVLDGTFWDISQSQVVAFGSKDDQREVSLRKVQDRWQYSLEPDFPIDPEKVTQHLSRIINIKTPRYVEYDVSSLADYGLDAPAHRFFFELDDGKRHELLVSGMALPAADHRRYATVADSRRVFVLDASVLDLGAIKLERFEADE